MHLFFQPKTPYAALRAAEEGLLPPEAFIHKAVSIEPVIDNPDNLSEIERILGQKKRDLKLNMLLMDILGKLIKDPDKEKALFAAESINAIENDYNRALEALKPEDHRERARLYMEMAELNKSAEDLKNFYLHEAFSSLRELEKNKTADSEDYLKMCRILIELNMPVPAKNTIIENNISGVEAKFLLAEIAFKEQDYSELYDLICRLNMNREQLDSAQIEIIDFWLGNE